MSSDLRRKITNLSSKIINRRNGTNIEDVYAIDKTTGRILSYVKGKANYGVNMSEQFKKVLTTAKDRSIIILHNHPLDVTFSTNDIKTASQYKSIGIVIASAHSGKVHYAEGSFGNYETLLRDFRVSYTKNVNLGKADNEARMLAWHDSLEKAGIKYGVN